MTYAVEQGELVGNMNTGETVRLARPDLFVGITRHGLEVSMPAPWNSGWERVTGLERAAAEIVRACRRTEQG